jgi:hypothetical protein
MRILTRHLLAALLIVVVGVVVQSAGRHYEQTAGARLQLLTMAFDRVETDGDAQGQHVNPLLGLLLTETDRREDRAAARYWRRRYADVLEKAPSATAGAGEHDATVMLLGANAAYRSLPADRDGAGTVARLEGLLTQYADALRRAPWRFDAAFNYEFVARQRDALVRARGKTATGGKEADRSAPPHTIHGGAGAVPPGVDMSEFKVVVPKRSDERREQPEAGKGGPRARKG